MCVCACMCVRECVCVCGGGGYSEIIQHASKVYYCLIPYKL